MQNEAQGPKSGENRQWDAMGRMGSGQRGLHFSLWYIQVSLLSGVRISPVCQIEV